MFPVLNFWRPREVVWREKKSGGKGKRGEWSGVQWEVGEVAGGWGGRRE